jgi:hypothetical protein
MNKIKNLGFAGIVLTAATLSPALMADTVDLYYGPYAYNEGGEFTAVTSPSYNANYAASALVNVTDDNSVVQQGFETFCVQTGVDFTPYNWGNHTAYNFTYSLNSVGTGWNPSYAYPLAEGTAYLYSQFAQGILSGYDYTDTSTRITDAGELQSAIWALQGGQSYPGFSSGTSGNPYYTDAVDALGANVDVPATLSTDDGVEIMNLTDGNGNSAQNQLIYLGGGSGGGNQKVPDNGGTLGLLGMSAAGLAFFACRSGAVKRAL